MEEPLRTVLRSIDAPPPKASGSARKNYTERLSIEITDLVAARLRELDLPGVRSPRGRDKQFMGGYGSKGVDAYLSDEKHGLLLASGTKGILYDVRKNLKNRYRDIVMEALELHKRFPYAICGHLLFLGKSDVMQPNRNFGTVLGEAVALLGRIGGRDHPEEAPELYEAVGILTFDPGEPESLDLAPASVPEPFQGATYCERLVEIFRRRNPFYRE